MPNYDFLINDTDDLNPCILHEEDQKWKILIVDDEEDIHVVTKVALQDFSYQNRGLEFFHAYSSLEAQTILEEHDDIALLLLDIVMETKYAGLNLVQWVRTSLKNEMIRIVLRTGYPGDAPEQDIIVKYDINDYKEKSELTNMKLFSLVYTSLRTYQVIDTLTTNQNGMKKIISSTENIFNEKSLALFLDGVFEQIFGLYKLKFGSICNTNDTVALVYDEDELTVVSRSGIYEQEENISIESEFGVSVNTLLESKQNIIKLNNEKLAIVLKSTHCESAILFMHNIHTKSNNMIDFDLLQVFINNVNAAFENLTLYKEMEKTQKEIAYRLGEAVETRSKESGFHVKRVSLISEILAKKYGKSETFVNYIKIASPLHDIGKIAISDDILHKKGPLTSEEQIIIRTHSRIGSEMLKGSKLEIMKVAQRLALYHHEQWNGEGYPSGIKGKDIPIEARITSVADVFDALIGHRCYKEPWSLVNVIEFFKEQRGEQFDPDLVDILLDNIPEIIAIYKKYQD